MTLAEIKIGDRALITTVGGEGALRQHFLDMGVIPGVEVTMMKHAPMGDPLEIRLHGYELTLRKDDAKKIAVTPVKDKEEIDIRKVIKGLGTEREHPGLGEGGHYHEEQQAALRQAQEQEPRNQESRNAESRNSTETKNSKPEKDKVLSIALVGNQNCGKTTLFNQLTGANQHVGNFPGVTVSRKDGIVRGHSDMVLTDLPGIYSLSPYTAEEIVSRQFIFENRPDGIINIVDATCIERSLYLTMQLMELGIPMVLATNMMDEVENNGGMVRINELEHLLGIPVIPISAMKNQGVEEVSKHIHHVAKYGEGPLRQDFCSPLEHGGAVHRCIHAVMHLIEDHAQRADIPIRFATNKLVEGDPLIEESLNLSQNEKETIEHILQQMEEERGMDRQAAMASMRFDFIEQVCRGTVIHPSLSKEHIRSQKIDRFLTGRWTAFPAFIAIMGLIFYLTFNTVGAWLQDICQQGIDWFTEISDQTLSAWDIAPAVHSLIIDGIYNGVGTVLVFIPLIILLFFFLSMLEDTGYMARIAFVMDKLLRRLGLSGRSIVSLLLGFGCSVPSVMSSRTLPSERDRRLTIMLTPFMSCTAKIPIYAFFAAAFFPGKGALVMVSLYLIGVTTGILVALILKRTLFQGEAVPFVMELPNYRLPIAKNVLRLLWDKTKDFLQRAFTIIFVASIVIWFLQTFTFQMDMVTEGQEAESILAKISNLVVPVFEPLGLGDWRIVTSLVSGVLAKEVVVSTISTLFSGVAITSVFSAHTAYTLLVFCLLYTPCVATMATIRRELGTHWMLLIMIGQCVIAWLVAFLVHCL